MKYLEMESLLKKAKEIDSLAVSIVKNKNVNEAVNFIAQDIKKNVFLLSVIAKANPQLATEIAINIKKQFPNEKINIVQAISMGAKGGDVYYEARRNQSSDKIRKLKELKEKSDKRKMTTIVVGDEEGQKKYIAISENINEDIQKEKKSEEEYSVYSKVIKSQQISFSAFLLDSLYSPDNEILSKEKLVSLCRVRFTYEEDYYQYDKDGNEKPLNEEESRKVDEEKINQFVESYISSQSLADGVLECVGSCVLPENVEKLDREQIREIVLNANMENFNGCNYEKYDVQRDLYKYLAVKYSEWLMKKEAPGFDIMDAFLPRSYFLGDKRYDTNYQENARAIFKKLKTSEAIQKWMKYFDKVPLDKFLEKVPELQGIDVNDSTAQIFVPAKVALKYAKCREKYFPHQSVEECLNKSSKAIYPPTHSFQSLDLMAVSYVLYKVVNSENSQNDRQESQIISREYGGR